MVLAMLPDELHMIICSVATVLGVALGARCLRCSLRRAASGGRAELARAVWKTCCCRGRRARGRFSGLRFPICVDDLTCTRGPEFLTAMLRHGGHLPAGGEVTRIQLCSESRSQMGDKAIIECTYSQETTLPRAFFVKFNTRGSNRFMVELLQMGYCEARFYHDLADKVAAVLKVPKCYFVDISETTGELVILMEVLCFGEGGLLPPRHRSDVDYDMEEVRLLVQAGARLNAIFLGDRAELATIPRADQQMAAMMCLMGLVAKKPMGHTMDKTVLGAKVKQEFMTWEVPAELLVMQGEILRDAPHIIKSLCADPSMLALSHNDLTLDNVCFTRDALGKLRLDCLFDWGSCCMTNVGLEWFRNLHFLPPAFLDEHEDELVDLILNTYHEHGVQISRPCFLNAYVLSAALSFVSEAVLLHRRMVQGVEEEKDALHVRCRFTNTCNIMRRHDFIGAWQHWQTRNTTAEGTVQATNSRGDVRLHKD